MFRLRALDFRKAKYLSGAALNMTSTRRCGESFEQFRGWTLFRAGAGLRQRGEGIVSLLSQPLAAGLRVAAQANRTDWANFFRPSEARVWLIRALFDCSSLFGLALLGALSPDFKQVADHCSVLLWAMETRQCRVSTSAFF